MKMSTQIALTTVGLLGASAGVLYPMHGTITSLEQELVTLESNGEPTMDIADDIDALKARIAAMRDELAGRSLSLCPDTLEARSQIEAAIQAEIEKAGLHRIARDRSPASQIAGVPCFVVELVVEGRPEQLHAFLLGIESLRWATRVLDLDIKTGEELRRTTLKIAVLLESES